MQNQQPPRRRRPMTPEERAMAAERRRQKEILRRRAMRRYYALSLIHISEPTRLGMSSYAVFCLKKKKRENKKRT